MKATTPYLELCFEKFNAEYFDGKLPRLQISLSRAKSYLGRFCYERGGLLASPSYRILINCVLDFPEQQLQDVLLHEMIHYYICYNGIRDTSTHGKVFREMMTRINSRGGRHISVSARLGEEQKAQLLAAKAKWRVIAVVRLRDGRTCIKLLPRDSAKILRYNRLIRRAAAVEDIAYYMEPDPWFGRYPTSSAVNLFRINAEELQKHITGRTRLLVERGNVKVISEPEDIFKDNY